MRDQEIPVKRNFVKVVVHVEDCNDHSPAFLSPRYEAIISDQAPAGSEVIRVKALDKDMGSNADISYSLHSGKEGGKEATCIYPFLPFVSPVFTSRAQWNMQNKKISLFSHNLLWGELTNIVYPTSCSTVRYTYTEFCCPCMNKAVEPCQCII